MIVDVAPDPSPDTGHNGDGEEVVRVRVRVRDTGMGMAPETLEQLFTPFVQADSSTTRKFGGTGLGLAISKRLADLMGGTIEVESTLGEGSCFTFILPVVRRADVGIDPPHQATGEGVLPTPPSADGARILLAADNKVNQLVAVRMLKKWGYEVVVVEDGQQAVAAVVRDHYDAILMDCQMPVMDGYDATRSIRRLPGEESNIPIIAMTANAMQGDTELCMAAGMDDYVTKPFNTAHLSSVLDQWSHGRRPTQPVS